MSVLTIQNQLGVLADGRWGGLSQEAIELAIENKQYKLDFDFGKFKELFKTKSINQEFVDGVNSLFTAFNSYPELDSSNPLYVAYMLATAYHETAYTMAPITEYGGVRYFDKYDTGKLAERLGNTPEKDGDGYKYRGRGHVMITGYDNYAKFSKILGADLINNPDLALDSIYSAQIMVIGSLKGTFTTRRLSQYIKYGLEHDEWVNARRVINGTDDDKEIADHAVKFLQCVKLTKIKELDATNLCECCGQSIQPCLVI